MLKNAAESIRGLEDWYKSQEKNQKHIVLISRTLFELRVIHSYAKLVNIHKKEKNGKICFFLIYKKPNKLITYGK